MKGTIARGRWYEEDLARAGELAASAKNRAENAMIVDMMRNDLGRIARVGSVQVSDLFRVERYPTLWQMTSCVSAETDAGLAEIFAALFPCAIDHGRPEGQHDADHRPQRNRAAADLYGQHRLDRSPDAAPGSTWPFAPCSSTKRAARPSMAWAAGSSGTRRRRASMTSAC